MLFNLIICDYFLPRGQLKTTSKSTKTSFQTLLWKIFWILLFFYETLISIFIIGTYGATYKKIHAPKETSLRWQFWSRYFIDLHCFHFHTHVLPFYFFLFYSDHKNNLCSFIKIIYPNIENILYLIIIKYFKQRYTS